MKWLKGYHFKNVARGPDDFKHVQDCIWGVPETFKNCMNEGRNMKLLKDNIWKATVSMGLLTSALYGKWLASRPGCSFGHSGEQKNSALPGIEPQSSGMQLSHYNEVLLVTAGPYLKIVGDFITGTICSCTIQFNKFKLIQHP
jgi:hypothetical protein